MVVPTFNESENVGNLVNQIDYALRGIEYEVVFVDDSTDNTPEVIEEVMKENPNVLQVHGFYVEKAKTAMRFLQARKQK